ncbi:hypothetical protein DFJ74DRAFT_706359 [Hyaloraphidium curvatum]|nr:hypothetical protein DFJ74DRAFT_706359 [Hyaloraphidium curvatum]
MDARPPSAAGSDASSHSITETSDDPGLGLFALLPYELAFDVLSRLRRTPQALARAMRCSRAFSRLVCDPRIWKSIEISWRASQQTWTLSPDTGIPPGSMAMLLRGVAEAARSSPGASGVLSFTFRPLSYPIDDPLQESDPAYADKAAACARGQDRVLEAFAETQAEWVESVDLSAPLSGSAKLLSHRMPRLKELRVRLEMPQEDYCSDEEEDDARRERGEQAEVTIFQAVAGIYQNCPELRRLDLEFIAASEYNFWAGFFPSHSQLSLTKLEHLELNVLQEKKYFVWADSLARLFPRLRSLRLKETCALDVSQRPAHESQAFLASLRCLKSLEKLRCPVWDDRPAGFCRAFFPAFAKDRSLFRIRELCFEMMNLGYDSGALGRWQRDVRPVLASFWAERRAALAKAAEPLDDPGLGLCALLPYELAFGILSWLRGTPQALVNATRCSRAFSKLVCDPKLWEFVEIAPDRPPRTSRPRPDARIPPGAMERLLRGIADNARTSSASGVVDLFFTWTPYPFASHATTPSTDAERETACLLAQGRVLAAFGETQADWVETMDVRGPLPALLGLFSNRMPKLNHLHVILKISEERYDINIDERALSRCHAEPRRRS